MYHDFMENNLSGFIENNVHHLPVRVYYSETDAEGIVYYSRYLDMAEHGRSELLRFLGGHQKEIMEKQKIAFVVKSTHVDYKRPGVMDDLLFVKTTITKCERFTIVFHQEICRDDEILTTLDTKVGSISTETGRPVPMPEEIKGQLLTVANL